MNELIKDLRDVLLNHDAEIVADHKAINIFRFIAGGMAEHLTIEEKYLDAAILDINTDEPCLELCSDDAEVEVSE